METKKPRYRLNDSREVYSVFLAIISEPGITFQNLAKKVNKTATTLSQQLKPLIKDKIVIKEGSGKKQHHLILKVSEDGLENFLSSNSKYFKEEIVANKKALNINLNMNVTFKDYATEYLLPDIEACTTFDELLRSHEQINNRITQLYLF